MDTDIRWKQRFSNYEKALAKLNHAVQLATQRPLTELEEQGIIQAFEFTHELAWNVMKDYLAFQGHTEIRGSRDAIRLAFQNSLITDGETWMDTIASRNKSTHTYNAQTARELIDKITTHYPSLFNQLHETMSTLQTP